MPFIPPEQLARAREMDLLTYLRCCEPEELVSVGGNAYATKSHDSLKISNGEWYWWSRGVGGSSALDYLTTVRKLSLPDAVQRVLSVAGTLPAEMPRRKARPTKPFLLPPRHADNRRVFSYLRGRGIDPEIINHCIKHGLLYESEQYHNCVFVGFAGDKPAYAMQRGTLQDKRFVGEVVGSDKRYSFAVPMTPGDSPTLCVFESAIDALSYGTTYQKLAAYNGITNPNIIRVGQKIKIPGTAAPKKTNAEIAKEVIAAKWGNGADRKRRLEAAGYDYNAIQQAVNAALAR